MSTEPKADLRVRDFPLRSVLTVAVTGLLDETLDAILTLRSIFYESRLRLKPFFPRVTLRSFKLPLSSCEIFEFDLFRILSVLRLSLSAMRTLFLAERAESIASTIGSATF